MSFRTGCGWTISLTIADKVPNLSVVATLAPVADDHTGLLDLLPNEWAVLSTIDGVRWKNVSATEEYVARVGTNQSPAGELRCLSRDERLGDALFTALRLTEGADIAGINARYAVDAWSRFGQDLQRFVEFGLLEVTGDRWRLTRPGMLLAHEVMTVFV